MKKYILKIGMLGACIIPPISIIACSDNDAVSALNSPADASGNSVSQAVQKTDTTNSKTLLNDFDSAFHEGFFNELETNSSVVVDDQLIWTNSDLLNFINNKLQQETDFFDHGLTYDETKHIFGVDGHDLLKSDNIILLYDEYRKYFYIKIDNLGNHNLTKTWKINYRTFEKSMNNLPTLENPNDEQIMSYNSAVEALVDKVNHDYGSQEIMIIKSLINIDYENFERKLPSQITKEEVVYVIKSKLYELREVYQSDFLNLVQTFLTANNIALEANDEDGTLIVSVSLISTSDQEQTESVRFRIKGFARNVGRPEFFTFDNPWTVKVLTKFFDTYNDPYVKETHLDVALSNRGYYASPGSMSTLILPSEYEVIVHGNKWMASYNSIYQILLNNFASWFVYQKETPWMADLLTDAQEFLSDKDNVKDIYTDNQKVWDYFIVNGIMFTSNEFNMNTRGVQAEYYQDEPTGEIRKLLEDVLKNGKVTINPNDNEGVLEFKVKIKNHHFSHNFSGFRYSDEPLAFDNQLSEIWDNFLTLFDVDDYGGISTSYHSSNQQDVPTDQSMLDRHFSLEELGINFELPDGYFFEITSDNYIYEPGKVNFEIILRKTHSSQKLINNFSLTGFTINQLA